ncbi:hypothetical protein, partial [Salinibacter altiplanensis]|uniref:hypothetical protein n=1 Tax=Salinibacter altiplanensis TaxID=1803181 RepID=UPI001F46F5AD
NKVVPAGKRFDCRPQVALLRAPSSVEHDDGVAPGSCSAELHDVEIGSAAGFQVPVFSTVGEMLPASRKRITDEKKQDARRVEEETGHGLSSELLSALTDLFA